MRNKDRVGALAACGVRDDGGEDPSLSALHRVWHRRTNLVLGIATYNQLFYLTSEILREYSKTSVTSLLGSMAFLDITLYRLCNRVRFIRAQHWTKTYISYTEALKDLCSKYGT